MHPLTISLSQMVFTPLTRSLARRLLCLVASVVGKVGFTCHSVPVSSTRSLQVKTQSSYQASLFLLYPRHLPYSSAIEPFPVLHARYLNFFNESSWKDIELVFVKKRGCTEICPDGMSNSSQIPTNFIDSEKKKKRRSRLWKGNTIHFGQYRAITLQDI